MSDSVVSILVLYFRDKLIMQEYVHGKCHHDVMSILS